jgi:hypothetical protein
MKTVLTIAACALLLGGCAKDATMSLDLDGDGQKEEVTVDRYMAAVLMNRDTQNARRARYDAKIATANARAAEAKARENTTIIEIKTPDMLREYNSMERERQWADANERLADVAESQADVLYTIHNPEPKPTVPLSDAAEFVSETFDGFAKVLDKPASMAGVVGVTFGRMAVEMNKEAGNDFDLRDSNGARLSGLGNKALGGDHSTVSAGDHHESQVTVSGHATSGELDQSRPSTVTDTRTTTTEVTDESYNTSIED